MLSNENRYELKSFTQVFEESQLREAYPPKRLPFGSLTRVRVAPLLSQRAWNVDLAHPSRVELYNRFVLVVFLLARKSLSSSLCAIALSAKRPDVSGKKFG